jgi:membrane protein DedA with SNARE-associated domain
MPLGSFLIYTAVGSAIWNTILIVAGYLLGTQYDRVEGFVKVFQYVVIAAVLAAVAYFLYRRLGRRGVTGTPA